MPPTPFFCTLCQKGYARATELEAHENSYDHQHKKRLREMKTLTRQSGYGGADKPRRKDASDSVLGSNTRAPVRAVAEKQVEQEEEMVTIRGPVRWDDLATLDEVVDLQTDRPPALEAFASARMEWEKVRRDDDFYKSLWAEVAAERRGEAEDERVGLGGAVSESEDEARGGLGAGASDDEIQH